MSYGHLNLFGPHTHITVMKFILQAGSLCHSLRRLIQFLSGQITVLVTLLGKGCHVNHAKAHHRLSNSKILLREPERPLNLSIGIVLTRSSLKLFWKSFQACAMTFEQRWECSPCSYFWFDIILVIKCQASCCYCWLKGSRSQAHILHQIAHITILGCSTKKQQNFPRLFHAQMCQYIVLYAPLLPLVILLPYGNIMTCII